MKVLQVIDFLNVGGAERICVMLSNLLFRKKYDIHMLILVEDGILLEELDAGIPLIRLLRKNKYNVVTMYRCACILKRYELVHVHMRHNYRYLKLIQILFNVKSKLVLHDHYGSIEQDVSIPFGFLSIFKPRYYIGVSTTLICWAKNKLKIVESNLFLLSNTVVASKSRTSYLKQGLVLVGNIKPLKNQLFAIRLMQDLDSTLTIYGTVQDAKYYQELLQEINILNLKDRVFFVHDCISIQKELGKYEMALQTAYSESGPLVLIEYLAQGIPFLSYNTGQVIQQVQEDLSVLVLDTFERSDWLKRINELKIMDLDRLKVVYKKYFDETIYLNTCEQIYKSILAS